MADGADDLPIKQRKPAKRGIVAATVVTLALLLSIGWSAGWYILKVSVQGGLDAWLDDERASGKNWQCADRAIDGFPFRVAVHCHATALSARLNGRDIQASAGELVVHSDFRAPRTIIAELNGPLRLASADGRLSAIASWEAVQADITNPGGAEPRFAIEIKGVVIDLTVNGAPAPKISAQRVSAEARPQGQLQGQPVNIDLNVTLEGLQAPPIDDLTGERAPANAQVAGRLVNFTQIAPGNLPQTLEIWRRSKGEFDFERAQFSKGALSIGGSGSLALDAAHRVTGQIEVEAAGVGPLLPKLGLSPGALAIGNLLGGASTPLRLPMNMKNGRVSVGVIPTPLVLLPLY